MLKKYATDALLAQAASAGGVEEVRIAKTAAGDYAASVKIANTGERIYLATRRQPAASRSFKSIDGAAHVLHRLLGIKRFIVVVR
jgi:hypothetical protein